MPNRPPRLQKSAGASGTPQVETEAGDALHRHVDEPDELARLQTLVEDLLVGHDDKIAHLAELVLGKLRNRHLQHREGRVGARQRRHVEPADLRERAGSPRSAPSDQSSSFSRSTICSTPPSLVP